MKRFRRWLLNGLAALSLLLFAALIASWSCSYSQSNMLRHVSEERERHPYARRIVDFGSDSGLLWIDVENYHNAPPPGQDERATV